MSRKVTIQLRICSTFVYLNLIIFVQFLNEIKKLYVHFVRIELPKVSHQCINTLTEEDILWKIREHYIHVHVIVSLTTEIFSFSSSFFLLFLVFFVRGVRLGEASLPATPSIFFFFVLVPPFALCEVTVVALVVNVSSRLSLCINTGTDFYSSLENLEWSLSNWIGF